jgi:hypothetical protein
MPFNGISFVRETLPCYAKMLSGEHAKKNHKGRVYYGEQSKREYEQLIDGLLPQFRSYFKENYEGEETIGHVLVRRAAFYQPPSEHDPHAKNEQQRFLSPDFELAYKLVGKTLDTQRPITNDDIGEARETALILKYGDWPGVYINSDLNRLEVLYLGKAQKIKDRIKGHLNSPLYLSSVLGTVDASGAKLLEDLLHDYLLKAGAEPYREGSKTKGLYKFPSGVNAMKELEKLLEDRAISIVMRNVTRER